MAILPPIIPKKPATVTVLTSSLPLLAQAFKMQSIKINPYESKIPANNSIDSVIKKDADYNLLGNSLGNPVYTNLTILSGSYTDSKGREITYPRIDLESVLITVNLPRNIVKTEIQGRDNSVKEYIGEGDAVITINGIIAGLNGHYPAEEVSQLKQVIKAPVAVEVISPYLQNLDIYNIVFEDRELGQAEGGYSYQMFTLNAVSDLPQELRIGNV